MSHLNHIHMIATVEINKKLKSEDACNAWLNELIKLIDMVVFFEPVTKECNEPENFGYSSLCMLTTSHISAHFFDHNAEDDTSKLQMDLYSCKEFSVDTVLDHLRIMEPKTIDYMIIDRNGRNTVIDQRFIEF